MIASSSIHTSFNAHASLSSIAVRKVHQGKCIKLTRNVQVCHPRSLTTCQQRLAHSGRYQSIQVTRTGKLTRMEARIHNSSRIASSHQEQVCKPSGYATTQEQTQVSLRKAYKKHIQVSQNAISIASSFESQHCPHPEYRILNLIAQHKLMWNNARNNASSPSGMHATLTQEYKLIQASTRNMHQPHSGITRITSPQEMQPTSCSTSEIMRPSHSRNRKPH
ncbi:hypothetical protein AVEN_21960-1 [Araneus ventricosus]|uniref:Uncharacterized protein n=1 Tax=Araneus ventricosus TaxID=182803 RepID=A0A4Y2NMC4_ARAVE|nr:hypothetical protein AVEN_21960-1 [Araneus ventricosus]